MFHQWSRRFPAAVLGVCLCTPAALSQTAPATGPWSKVPALSVACYSGTDPFVARVEKALTAVKADRDRQAAINKQIADAHSNLDPMEQVQRMQQWMMSNPQEAMKYMQGIQAHGTEAGQENILEDGKEQAAFDVEKKDVIKRYHASLAQAKAPATARWKALLKKLEADENAPTVKEPGVPEWAMTEEDAVKRLMDQSYATHCPQWWAAAGSAQTWLKKYRNWLVQDHTPFVDGLEAQKAQTYAIMSTPTAAYRSLGTVESVIRYLEVVAAVYGERREKPICDATGCAMN
ncbi:MAG: hypothetical protein ACREEP_09760 [Dongiaceae bacterium]